ncbi:MAG TPA: hypothetical protein VMB23_03950 [Spirochaetia bacterium]|jgi:hypothetical protein|nr:hypothetical protein [Spirochaetia bacterium]
MTELLAGPIGPELVARMALGFVAAVAGIALWAHSREASWIFVIAATLLGYIETLLRFLDGLGLVILDTWTWEGIPLVRTGFAVAVPLLYAVGLFLAIRSYRKP